MKKNFEAIEHKDVRGSMLFYIKLTHGEKTHLINVGLKTFEAVKELEKGQVEPGPESSVNERKEELKNELPSDEELYKAWLNNRQLLDNPKNKALFDKDKKAAQK